MKLQECEKRETRKREKRGARYLSSWEDDLSPALYAKIEKKGTAIYKTHHHRNWASIEQTENE